MKIGDFIVAVRGEGRKIERGQRAQLNTHFEKNSLGLVEDLDGSYVEVLLVGPNQKYVISKEHVRPLDLEQTGDAYDNKICNRCHVLKPIEEFKKNQTQKGGRVIRRPSCQSCRLDIDRRYVPAHIKKAAEKNRPAKGSVWRCPICEKQTIVDVTVKLVLDHDHRSGKTRGYICDSCNTGLGRFRDDRIYLENAIKWLLMDLKDAMIVWDEEGQEQEGLLEE